MLVCRFSTRLRLVQAICCAQLLVICRCAPQNAPLTYPVDGVVEDSITHHPIARVLVEGMNNAVLTDGQGRFELDLPSGTISMRLRRPGYGGEGPNNGPFATHLVQVTPGMSPLTLHLMPLASIVAHVELSTGDPPDGVRFFLYRRAILDGRTRWIDSAISSANSEGIVRFYSLAARGSYVLCSAPSSDSTGIGTPGVEVYGYPEACFPGDSDLGSAIASPLTLQPGQKAELNVELARQLFYPVSISVAGASQNPVPRIQIYGQDGQPMSFGAYRDPRDGTFHTNLPNGSYYAEVYAGRGPGPLRFGRVEFTVAGGPVSGLTLAPLPAQPITVEIHREFTAMANEQQAHSFAEAPDQTNPGVNLSLLPAGNPVGNPQGGTLRHAPDAPYGDVYQWQVAAQGRFWVHADSFGPYYISSITSGSDNLASQPLDIGPGGTANPIEITLRNDTGRLTCMVALPHPSTSAQPAGAEESDPPYVYVIPLFPTVQNIALLVLRHPETPSNPIDLPPGEYLVVASFQQQEFDRNDPKEITWLTAKGRKVTVQPGQTSSVLLDKVISSSPGAGP